MHMDRFNIWRAKLPIRSKRHLLRISGHCFFPSSDDQLYLLAYANHQSCSVAQKVFNRHFISSVEISEKSLFRWLMRRQKTTLKKSPLDRSSYLEQIGMDLKHLGISSDIHLYSANSRRAGSDFASSSVYIIG